MTKSSLQLIAECQQRGLLSKEASSQLLEQREQMIKNAMKKAAAGMFGKLLRRKQPLPVPAPPVGKGILGKLKHGGRTPEVPGKSPVAGWSDVIANLGKMMALAGMTAGATAGVGGLINRSRGKKLRGEIDRSYLKMFKEHPQLKDLEEEKPGIARRHFGVLARYAPSLAADPVVAGQWVSSTATLGQLNIGDIKNLAEIQRQVDQSREDRGPMSQAPLKATEFATKAMMA